MGKGHGMRQRDVGQVEERAVSWPTGLPSQNTLNRAPYGRQKFSVGCVGRLERRSVHRRLWVWFPIRAHT